ncbi:MAG: hypothetical protein HYS45_02905 [Parcubacteria group bacterium]|nr:hypothetical protein [Parcubacteria group bacterium]
MPQEEFPGAKKQATSFTWNAEQRMVRAVTPHVPSFLGTRRLTMLTLLWSALVVYFSWRSQQDIRWLAGASGILAAQYLTDVLDGALGRYRNSGFVRWGFYMDHLLDFVFAASVFIGYALVVDASALLALFIFFIACTIIPVSTFLSFSGYNAFKIGTLGFGPTEYRLAIILLNAAIIYFGISAFERALPYLAGLLFAYSFVLVYRTQKDMYRMDMRNKK